MFVERRRAERVPVRLGGYLVLAVKSSSVPCAVQELSRIGAKLKLQSDFPVPRKFLLLLGGTDLVECKTARQDGMTVGVEFSAPWDGITAYAA